MKNLFSKLRYTPKRFAITAALMVASTTTALAFAWGPDRPTFTIENPAQYVTFNSITKIRIMAMNESLSSYAISPLVQATATAQTLYRDMNTKYRYISTTMPQLVSTIVV